MTRTKGEKRKSLTKAEKRRRKSAKQSGQAVLLERVGRSDLFPGKKIIVQNPLGEKMSEVILAYAKPMLDAAGSDKEGGRRAVSLAIALWNLSHMPAEKQKEETERLTHILHPNGDEERLQEGRNFIRYFVERRKELFPHNERLILDYQITDTREGLHLDVASSVKPVK